MSKEKVVKDKKLDNLKWLILILSLVVLDQITKAIVVSKIKLYNTVRVLGDFVVFQHIRNRGAGFGVGGELSGFLRVFVLYVVPLILVSGIVYILVNAKKYKIETNIEKISLSLVVAGGIGNLIDRLFRPEGVVDFVNIKVYGLFGYDYWPTFNVADASVVVGIILLFVFTLIINPLRDKKKNN